MSLPGLRNKKTTDSYHEVLIRLIIVRHREMPRHYNLCNKNEGGTKSGDFAHRGISQWAYYCLKYLNLLNQTITSAIIKITLNKNVVIFIKCVFFLYLFIKFCSLGK